MNKPRSMICYELGCGGQLTVKGSIGVDAIPNGDIVDTIGIKSVATIHANVEEKLPFEDADVLIANSNFSLKLATKFGVDSHKIRIITGGVNTNRFKFSPKYEEPYKILSICRFVDFKGIDKSLDIINNLLNLGHKIEFNLIMTFIKFD